MRNTLLVIAAMIIGGCESDAEIKAQQKARQKALDDLEAKAKAVEEQKTWERVAGEVRTIRDRLDANINENGLFNETPGPVGQDEWGGCIIAHYRKNNENSVTMTVRSPGPDGVPNNSDDIYTTTTRWRKGRVQNAVEAGSGSFTKGAVKGVIDAVNPKEKKR